MARSMLLSVLAVTVSIAATVHAQAVPDLIATLKGEDEAARLAARETLADAGPEAVEPLLGLVTSDESRVEQAARQTLLLLVMRWSNTPERQTKVCEPLLEVAAAKGDLTVRRLALNLIGKVADERTTPYVVELLHDPDVAFAACECLHQIPGTPPTAALAVALEWAPPDLQVALLHGLGRRADRRSVPDVTKALASQTPEVRAAAASALGQIAAQDGAESLTRALTDDDGAVKQAAADSCLRLAGTADLAEARRLYTLLLTRSPDDAGVVGALAGLARVGTEQSVEVVAPLLRHDSRRVQIAAAAALGHLPGSRATETLAAALRTASPYVVIAGLEALGERGDPDALAAVRALAGDQTVTCG
jgi:HEAT repeat protein